MSSIRKLTKLESAAYTASQRATQAVVLARLDKPATLAAARDSGLDIDALGTLDRALDAEIARLTRRAAAHRAQWLGLASKLELMEAQRVYA